MTDAEYEFYSFWEEILLEERAKNNINRVKEIEEMLKHNNLPIPQDKILM